MLSHSTPHTYPIIAFIISFAIFQEEELRSSFFHFILKCLCKPFLSSLVLVITSFSLGPSKFPRVIYNVDEVNFGAHLLVR